MKKQWTNMMSRFFVFALVVGFVLPVSADFDVDRLSAVTEQGMELWHVPGMSVAVVTADQVLMQKGFGDTANKDGRAVDKHTLFAIASTTKAMVVAGILMLVDEGKLSLDDPITKLVPELQFNNPMLNQELNIRDLLAHRTGLPSTDFWTFFQGMPLDEQIQRLQTVETVSPIRTRLIYQNTMFEIAGLVIERLSGQPWHHFLAERLWQPIGMLETYGARSQIKAEQSYVTPHMYQDERLSVAQWDFPAGFADAAGSVWSSIHDMSLWAQFLLNDGVTRNGDRLVSEKAIKQMFEPHQLSNTTDFYPTTALTKPNWRSYGLGWFQQDFQGRKIDFHTGSLSGLIALIGLDRANEKAVIILGNRDHAEMRHALLWDVMDTSAPAEKRDWNQEIFDLYAANEDQQDAEWKDLQSKRLKGTSVSLPVEAYAGKYSSPKTGDILIEQSDGAMILKTTRIDFKMSHWQLDTFLVEYESWGMREFAVFDISPEAEITAVNLFGERFERLKEE
jgi:CubicO group peptidase (beta-lactamase class C family)